MLKFNLTKEQAKERKIPQLADKRIYRKAITSIDRKVNEKERSLVHIISSSRPDRGRDVLVPTGMNTKDFRQYPIVPWGHNYGELPIGRSAWTKLQENEVIAKTIFNDTEKAEEIWNFVKDNPIGWSVGLTIEKIIDKWDDEFDEEFDNLVAAGYLKKKDKDKVTWIISEWNLVEYSAVTVPAQPNAVGGGPGIILLDDEPATELVHVLDENNEPVEKSGLIIPSNFGFRNSIERIGKAAGVDFDKETEIDDIIVDSVKRIEVTITESTTLKESYDQLEGTVAALTDENETLKEAAQEPEDVLKIEGPKKKEIDIEGLETPTEPESSEEQPPTIEDVIKIAVEVGKQVGEKSEVKMSELLTTVSDTVARALGKVTK